MWFVSISLFLHITRMDNNADAKEIITAVSLDDWKRPPGHRRFTFRQSMMTLSPTISYWLRQSSWRLQLWLALCSAGDTNEKLTWKFINMILVMPSSDGRCLFSHLWLLTLCALQMSIVIIIIIMRQQVVLIDYLWSGCCPHHFHRKWIPAEPKDWRRLSGLNSSIWHCLAHWSSLQTE